ncbi:MAG: hypothetical protein JO291_01840, partial [Acidimicrobiia bacterium]|nr:hypothetical protein [Acidimicrobiia bacterium]
MATLLVTAICVIVQGVGIGPAGANAANPNPDTHGTATVNPDGTVSADIGGTWVFAKQICSGRYSTTFGVDWWGLSASPLPANNFTVTNATQVTSPGVITRGSFNATGSIKTPSGQYFHVGPKYSGETVHHTGTTCVNTPTGSTGSWTASATYPSIDDIPAKVCVNMYDPHGKEGQASGSANDYSPTADHDNSIQTNKFDPAEGAGFCVALTVIAPLTLTVNK